MRNPPRLCSHRSGAALMLLLSSIFLFPASTPLFLHLYSFHISSPPLFAFLFPLFFFSFFFFYTSLSLFWLQNASLSLYLDALLSPWFLSLYLTSFSFFFSVEGQICKSAPRFISVVWLLLFDQLDEWQHSLRLLCTNVFFINTLSICKSLPAQLLYRRLWGR